LVYTGNLSALPRGSLTHYVSKEGAKEQKKDAGLSQQRLLRKPHNGARVALQRCPILRMSKALVVCPEKLHSKQAYAKFVF